MSIVNEIKKILGDSAPAQLNYAKETAEGVQIPVNLSRSQGWNRFYEERALGRALKPLADKNWSIEPGPKNLRTGAPSSLFLRPPATNGANTATLPLRDRVRVEGKCKRKNTGTDIVDALTINEEAGTVDFDSTGCSGYEQRLLAEVVDNLRSAGWTGPVSHRFGKSGIYGTLTAPAEGQEVTRARIDAFLTAPQPRRRFA